MSSQASDPERWARVKDLFLRAIALPHAQRDQFLEAHAGELLAEVRTLLESDAVAPTFMERPESALHDLLTPLLSPAATPALNQMIGSCRLLCLLGEGASGLVYLAEQSRPRRKVAVKILRPGQTSPAALRRIEREAEIMARLRHPGIAHVVESGVDPVGPFFVMEYVEGEPITHHVRRAALGIPDCLDLFLRVCDAVQHAHAMGVIHRDLKPANILVTASGQPKVLDFGIARTVDPDARQATLATTFGQLVGTLAYMSPEQAAGDTESVDTRADIYALGGILHELLAGRPPLDISGKPLHEALRIIQAEPAPRLGALARTCRGDLETIVGKALEKDPARRYSSVSELSGDILRHLDRLPIHARPPSAAYEFIRFTQRRRPLVAGVAIALAGMLGALAWSLATYHHEHQDYLVVRSVAGDWLADVMRKLGSLSGTYEARRHVVSELRRPLETFAQRHPHDLDVQANLAALEFASAEVDRETGDLTTAAAGFQRSFTIFSGLAKQRPDRADWRLEQSIAAVKVGDILRGQDEIDKAINWYEAALELDIAAARDFPDNYSANDQLVWSYDRLANMAAIQKRYDDARAYCDQLEQATQTVCSGWPDRPSSLWCRVCTLHMRAHILTISGHDDQALPLRLLALDRGRELVHQAPTNRVYVGRQIFALTAHASFELDVGNTVAAENLLAEALPLVERSLMLDGHARSSHDAAVEYYTRLARLHEARGDTRAQLSAAQAAVSYAREASRADPASSEAALQLIRVQRSHADLLAAMKRDTEAADATLSLRDTLLEMVALFPAKPEPFIQLAQICLSSTHPVFGDFYLARAAVERALQLTDKPGPDLLELLGDLAQHPADAPGAAPEPTDVSAN